MIFLFVLAAFIGYYMCKKENRDSFEGFAAIDDARQAVREVYNADIDAIRNLSTVATKLQAGGLNVPGVMKTNKINLTNDRWENQHEGNIKSYVVSDDGNYKKLMLVGNDSGGGNVRRVGMWDDVEISRNLQVNGGVNVNGNINGPSISTNNPTWNGWISGNFGMSGKDRVVIGNLENQATVGAHNNALNAWTPLRLQGDTINMIANNGVVTMQGRNILAELNNLNSKFANMTASQVFNVNRGDNGWNGRTSGNFTVGSGKKIFQINLSLFVNGNNGVDINFYFSNGFHIWCGSYINHGGNHTGQSFTRVIENSQLPAGNYTVRATCNLHVDGNDYLHASIITLPI